MADPYSNRFYAELGRIVVTWSQVEYLLKDILARLTGAERGVAYLLTSGMTTGRVLERCQWLAETAVASGEREPLVEWLRAASAALDARNRLFHGAWAAQMGTEEVPVQISYSARKGKVEHRIEKTSFEDVATIRRQIAQVLGDIDSIKQFLDG